jgi:hypothetical protein
VEIRAIGRPLMGERLRDARNNFFRQRVRNDLSARAGLWI